MIEQLIKTEGQSILTFKPGDLIIRVEPVKSQVAAFNPNLGVAVGIGEKLDNSHRTEPVEFAGIYNNLIYLRSLGRRFDGSRYFHKLLLEEAAEGWALFVVPDGLALDECISA